MFDKIKLYARLAVPFSALKALQSKLEAAFKANDLGRVADLIDEAIPHAQKVRDELRAYSEKSK